MLMQIHSGDRVAAVPIAEIGTDMSVFISTYHLAAWAGLCPGGHESAGKRRLERLGYVVAIQPKEAVPNPLEAAA